jgi:hypothetical protein
MRKIISGYLFKLGFVHKDLVEEVENELRKDVGELEGKLQELENTVSDYELVFKDCFESNHRLKKLEEYLGIKYVSEIPEMKTFIGYKKIK